MEPRGVTKAFAKVKRRATATAAQPRDGKRNRGEGEEGGAPPFLRAVCACVLAAGLGRARAELLASRLRAHGGRVSPDPADPALTHLLVAEDVTPRRLLRLLEAGPGGAGAWPAGGPAPVVVRVTWLSDCVAAGEALDPEPYRLDLPAREEAAGGGTPLAGNGREVRTPPGGGPVERGAAPAVATPPGPPPRTAVSRGEETGGGGASDDDNEEEARPSGAGAVTATDMEALLTGASRSSPPEASGHMGLPDQAADAEVRSGAAGGQDPGASAAPAPASLGRWVCAESSERKRVNHNAHITDKLEVLARAYQQTGDRWRALGYSKAINALKAHHRPVATYEEACALPGVGERLAKKVAEIAQSGELRQLQHLDPSVGVIATFTDIWGVGSKTAQAWYQQGLRTLDDVRARATLTRQQQIGLRHYDDLLLRMPRAEAHDIERTVCTAALAVDAALLCVACGSYRRGKSSCGDVDVLVTHPDGRSHALALPRILASLHASGFLTDDLVSHDEGGSQHKYMGVCRLPGPASRHRRLDLIAVPHAEFACALLYFTGSAHFNRSMRALARTRGMSLSERALSSGVARGGGGGKVGAGVALATPTERSVFELLELPFREPHERDW
ncbi:DNA polymerase lambda isoform X1 [Petromyzon marinus]|uniref:DNA polymerase lambda isoform X1 n=1 Tax=Petromyzon marinus TaxID=7757 RepID=UPI003F72231B